MILVLGLKANFVSMALALKIVALALRAVLGLGFKVKIMSLENWLSLFPVMIGFSGV